MKTLKHLLFIATLTLVVACNKTPDKAATNQDGTQAEESITQQGTAIENPVLDSLNHLLVQNPYHVNALVARSKYYQSVQNLQYAYGDAEAAYTADSTNLDAINLWAEANVLKNSRLSRDLWVKCARLYPKDTECREKLAGLYHIVGEYEKSKKLTDEIIALDKTNETAYFIKGLDYLDGIEDTASALIYLQKAIDLKPDYYEALDKIAVLYTSLKNPLAEAYYKRILELKPNNYLAYYNLGIFYSNIENWNKSLESLTMAIQLQPSNPETYFTLGTVFLKIGEIQDARDNFSKAIANSPSQANYRAFYARGYTFELLGDVTNARKDYQQAITYNPMHEPTKIALRRLNEQEKNPQK